MTPGTLLTFAVGLLFGFAACTAYSDHRVRTRLALLEQTDPAAARALARAFEGWEP